MSFELSFLREFEDKQVRMRFRDGHEVVANLISASQDMDGSVHLIYDDIVWSNEGHVMNYDKGTICHEDELLESIEEANA